MKCKKTTNADFVVRSEFVFSGLLEPKAVLMQLADLATAQFLKRIGQNARGDFRLLVQFTPDGGQTE